MLVSTPQPVTVKEIRCLRNNVSMGLDKIHVRFIQDGSEYISESLSYIFNLMLETGIFPDKLKIARVVPIYKAGDATLMNNYRPISVLPILSKVFERLLHKRLTIYLEENNLLNDAQFGFRKGMSTVDALLNVVPFIQEALSSGDFAGGLFLDLKKAFDTVNHQILIKKLDNLGIRGIILNLFKNYLSNRLQVVNIGSVLSDPFNIVCGVPQGSILGPLLFIIYTNDLPRNIHHGKISLYADDTAIFYRGKNQNQLQQVMKSDALVIHDWFRANKLTLNVDKCQIVCFSSQRKGKLNWI